MLLPEDERRTFLRSMRDPKTDLIRRARIRKRIIDACKKVSICPHCSAYNGIVKKVRLNAPVCIHCCRYFTIKLAYTNPSIFTCRSMLPLASD